MQYLRGSTSAIAIASVFLAGATLAPLSGGAIAQETSSQNQSAQTQGEPGHITGTVRHALAESALTGAIVTIEGLDISATVDERGTFRFSAVPAGTYTLTVNYVGLDPKEVQVSVDAGATVEPDITLGDELLTMEEIAVVGTRSAQASSLSKQRAAENVATVLSADVSGKFPDSTAAEAMRRAPGISLVRRERGGEGQHVSIRGLDSSLNNVKINGINSGNGGSRQVPFDVFQADSMSEIIINKSLLPYHDGEGIGGSVELKTRRPLQLGKQRISLNAEGRYGEYADKVGGRFSASYSDVLNDDETLGILASASYRKRYVRSYQFDVLGSYLPTALPLALEAGADPDDPDYITRAPEDTFLLPTRFGPEFSTDDLPNGDDLVAEDLRLNVFDNVRENIAGTLGFEWQATDTTSLMIIGNYNRTEESNTRNAIGFEQSDRYSDDDQYIEAGALPYYGSGPFMRIRGEVEDEVEVNSTLVFSGETYLDQWSFKYGVGYAYAKETTPNSIEIDFRVDDIEDEDPFGTGALAPAIGPDGERYIAFDHTSNQHGIPIPNLTDAGWASVLDPTIQELYGIATFNSTSKNNRYSAYFDTEYQPQSDWLRAIQFGFKFERSDFRDDFVGIVDDTDFTTDGTFGGDGDFYLSDTNLLTGNYVSLADIGTPIPNLPFLLEYDRGAIETFGAQVNETVLAAIASGDQGYDEYETYETREDIYAAYAQASMNWGDTTVIAGARLEHFKGDTFFSFDSFDDLEDLNIFGVVSASEQGSYTTVLPRLQVNYRPEGNWVIRGAAYTALARPSLYSMGVLDIDASDEDLANELGETPRVRIRVPNPGIDPAYAYNFELGGEYYFGKVGVISASFFYKHIEKFIYFSDTDTTGDNSLSLDAVREIEGLEGLTIPDEYDVSIVRVENGRSADIYGVELNFVRQFEDLFDGVLGGFGVYANLTLQESTADADIVHGYVREVPFFDSPDYVGNLALTFEKYGLDAALSYSFQGKQLDSVESWLNMDEYDQSYSSVDLNVKYNLPRDIFGKTQVYLQVTDLLNGGKRPINWETVGTSRKYLDDIEFIGREFRMGISVRF
ncbi:MULTISPECIES: TonB-dependent receptor [Kordiimonas]|jgi:TonB-dependent receptor|uniref:TonB-dependent receptor n=1 Tax=Kordiimonas TaxID=288021 RepID=UPI00257D0312|nr:TonB-dependent receptor [Kordiimonas sp. UBA4487]